MAQDEGQGTGGCSPATNDDDVMELKAAAHALLKRLPVPQLETLAAAVEGRGGEAATPCVPLPRGPVRLGRRSVEPHVLCCQVWRWPSLAAGAAKEAPGLKRLPECYLEEKTEVCCNPYHWSQCIEPGTCTCLSRLLG